MNFIIPLDRSLGALPEKVVPVSSGPRRSLGTADTHSMQCWVQIFCDLEGLPLPSE